MRFRIFAFLLLCLLSKELNAVPIATVQISTTALSQQSGAFNVSRGTMTSAAIGTLRMPMGFSTDDGAYTIDVSTTTITELKVVGGLNNDLGIQMTNYNTGTSAVSFIQSVAGSNDAALTIAAFGPNYGQPGGTRCGLVGNNLAVLESGGANLNGMVIETRLNVPIVFGINDFRTLILSTGSLTATFQGDVVATSGTFSGGLVGTATNNNARQGFIGEYISSQTAAQGNFSASAQASLAVALTAGDWDLSAALSYTKNGSITPNILVFIGATSASFGDSVTGINGFTVEAATDLPFTGMPVAIPRVRISIASSATYYLNTAATITSGTPVYRAILSARRVR